MTNLIIRINNSLIDSAYGIGGTWITVDPSNDNFIFSGGSVEVADGQPIPSESDLNRAGVQIDASYETIVPKYFLADVSANLLKEIMLAGNQNKRYVFCCDFDGATASEPILEAWDDDNMTTYGQICLGGGVPSLSWYKAICTTGGLPGADWIGVKLAGSGSSNRLLLNNGSGPLLVAGQLYFNFKIIVPAGVSPASFNPVLVVTYTTN